MFEGHPSFIKCVFVRPDVEVQAVFAATVVGFEPAGICGLKRHGSLLVKDRVRFEGHQSQSAGQFSAGVGNAEPRAHCCVSLLSVTSEVFLKAQSVSVLVELLPREGFGPVVRSCSQWRSRSLMARSYPLVVGS